MMIAIIKLENDVNKAKIQYPVKIGLFSAKFN